MSDRFSSLALCAKNNIEIKEYEYFPSINAIKFLLINHITDISQSIILLYRKHSSNILQYINGIRDILISYDIDLVLGDFTLTFLTMIKLNHLKPYWILYTTFKLYKVLHLYLLEVCWTMFR